MIREAGNIIARIAWCRLQQQLQSVIPEERQCMWSLADELPTLL